ncbi:MAG TPA: sialidase family protein [Vicinamibacteria bacterium]|nr:sialidase family protein [Vicinamibacteria bacterium]
MGADGRVLLSWIEPAGDQRHALRYASRTAGGEWSAARTIAEGTNWFVNWADVPSMAALPNGTLFAHWLARSGRGTYAYDVRVSISRDQGRTWSDSLVPHRDGTQTEHGFVTLTSWTPEQVGIVWLDGRRTAMSLMHTTIGSDGRLGAETVLDGRVCDCCQTDSARAAGATLVVYRDRTDTEVRDTSVVRFADGRWSEPRPLSHDGWQLDGCPVNGPAIAAAGKGVAVAWFTAPNEKSAVMVAFSTDSGATFAAPVVVDDGRPLGRVDVVMLAEDVALVSWLEQVENRARLRVRRVSSRGAPAEPFTVAESSGARSSGFPRMARAGDEVVIAWRDAAEPPRVRTAALRIQGGR